MQSLFEVHTLKGGQWQIDSTYSDKDSAIDTAKQLYGEKAYQAVKVVKDVFDPKTNASKELVIFDTSKTVKKEAAPPAEEAASPAPKSQDKPHVEPRQRNRPKPKESATGTVLKAVMWLILILGGGLLVIWGLIKFSNILDRLL